MISRRIDHEVVSFCLDRHFPFSFCLQDINDCDPDPCLNGGTCVDGLDSYSCSCPEGYVDDNCTTSKSVSYVLICEDKLQMSLSPD